jgi:hypothetical protein
VARYRIYVARLRNGEKTSFARKAIFRSVTVYYIYNIVALTVNIEFMWRGLEMGERQSLPEKLYLGQ